MFIENRIREKITMQEIVIIHMTDIVKGKRFEKSGLSSDFRNEVLK